MKKITIILFAGSFLFTPVMGQQHKQFDKNLAKPKEFNFSEKLGKQSNEFKKLLDQGDLEKFYARVKFLFDQINQSDRILATKEELTDQIWSFYLICGAPLYEVDWKTGDPWPYEESDDISAKYGVASFIVSTNIKAASKNTGIPEKILKKLGAIYFSSIMKTLRDGYVSGFNEKVSELTQKAFATFKDNFHQMQNNQSKISIQESRNNSIESILNTILEGDFVETLVKYYPDNATEVVKYIKSAGYGDDEIGLLIDRTIGRTPRTEYLYKGKIGREHDKRVKESQKNSK